MTTVTNRRERKKIALRAQILAIAIDLFARDGLDAVTIEQIADAADIAQPNLKFPAAWMQTPVAGTPNNWAEVEKTKEGKYQAGAGKETFDVTLTVSTLDGRILSATMENPVTTSSRLCDDAALMHCNDPQPHTIHRHVEITLVQ